ncbi:MAG: HTH domain-containing protein, partial [Thaumarchaeota archaeon]|nr:HTH domain-containing protein [Nitrososphaerota archaeon]
IKLLLNLGFDQDVFKLFVNMRGAATRFKLLQILETGEGQGKDRAELAQELNLDWKAIDRQMRLLEKYGFVRVKSKEGTTRLFELNPSGKILLDLLREQSDTDREKNP